MPISVSVLFVCPWYQEAVDILKKYPNVTVGVHLALNSEWRGYRWGPVLGKAGVAVARRQRRATSFRRSPLSCAASTTSPRSSAS